MLPASWMAPYRLMKRRPTSLEPRGVVRPLGLIAFETSVFRQVAGATTTFALVTLLLQPVTYQPSHSRDILRLHVHDPRQVGRYMTFLGRDLDDSCTRSKCLVSLSTSFLYVASASFYQSRGFERNVVGFIYPHLTLIETCSASTLRGFHTHRDIPSFIPSNSNLPRWSTRQLHRDKRPPTRNTGLLFPFAVEGSSSEKYVLCWESCC